MKTKKSGIKTIIRNDIQIEVEKMIAYLEEYKVENVKELYFSETGNTRIFIDMIATKNFLYGGLISMLKDYGYDLSSAMYHESTKRFTITFERLVSKREVTK